MAKTSDNPVVDQLLALLRGGQAHVDLARAVAEFPVPLRGKVPPGLPYSAWQLVEHLRFTQRDILDFSAPPTGGYHGHRWPEDYWSKSAKPPSAGAWDEAIAGIGRDLEKFEALLLKPGVDLHRPFLWGDGQTLLREALLIADHNAYHLGEIVMVRRLLGCWGVGAKADPSAPVGDDSKKALGDDNEKATAADGGAR